MEQWCVSVQRVVDTPGVGSSQTSAQRALA